MKPSQCEACRAVGPTVMCNLCPTVPRRSVQPPATPQEPSGAQLALADIERAYSETEVALAQVVSRNDKELFFNGDKALRAHLQKNLDYYRIRRDGVRALLASLPPDAAPQTCEWRVQREDDVMFWASQCGIKSFGPSETWKHCPYCGGELVLTPAEEPK